jgi:hypothetical protein
MWKERKREGRVEFTATVGARLSDGSLATLPHAKHPYKACNRNNRIGVDLINYICNSMNEITIIVMTAYPCLYLKVRNGGRVDAISRNSVI